MVRYRDLKYPGCLQNGLQLRRGFLPRVVVLAAENQHAKRRSDNRGRCREPKAGRQAEAATEPESHSGWQAFGQVVADPKAVYGGANTMLTTNFGDAGNQLFGNTPGCYMMHQASFITDFLVKGTPGVKPVTDFDFFPFPAFGTSSNAQEDIARA